MRKALVADSKTGEFQPMIWKNIKTGMVVKVHENEFFPADMILLYSSGPKGIAYIETKNLDGETNLKHKVTNKEVMAHCSSEEKAGAFRAQVQSEGPSDKIYQFDGMMTI
jgi:P-type E1-E2 ATPase